MSDPVTRRLNLLILLSDFISEMQSIDPTSSAGQHVAFAAKIQIAKSSLSGMKTGARPIGDKLARQIESCCSKPSGWLDIKHKSVSADDSLESYIAMLKKEFENSSEAGRANLFAAVRRRVSRNMSS